MQGFSISPDGSVIAVGHPWGLELSSFPDLDTAIAQIKGASPEFGVTFSPDSRLIAVHHKKQRGFKVWRIRDTQLMHEFTTEFIPLKMAFSDDGELLAAADAKGGVYVWRLSDRAQLAAVRETLPWDAWYAVTDMAFSTDKKRLVAAIRLSQVGKTSLLMRAWRISDGETIAGYGGEAEKLSFYTFARNNVMWHGVVHPRLGVLVVQMDESDADLVISIWRHEELTTALYGPDFKAIPVATDTRQCPSPGRLK